MSNYINHVTLTTGHCRRSPRDEVSDETLAILHPWMTGAIESIARACARALQRACAP